MFKKVIICRGIPGSGKSQFAKDWVSKDPERRVRLNSNNLRDMVGNNCSEHFILNLLKDCIFESLQYGYDIIIDNINLNPKEVEFIKDIVNSWNKRKVISDYLRYNYKIEFKDFFIPLPICIERDSKRRNPVGKETIIKIYNKYKNLIEDGMFNSIQTN